MRFFGKREDVISSRFLLRLMPHTISTNTIKKAQRNHIFTLSTQNQNKELDFFLYLFLL